MTLAGIAIASFLVAFITIRTLLSRFARLALDQPNARSLHERAVPRTGGIAVLAGASLSLFSGATALWLPLAIALVLAALSFIDDLRPLPTSLRLLSHLAAAAFLCWYVLSPMHPVEMVLLILAVVWLTNLFNFMDGSDGLAGGMAIIGFGAYAAAGYVAGQLPLASTCAALAAANAAFLLHNFSPARIFLGDVGSIPLGFLAGALGILGWRNDVWPLWFPLFVFGPFIADATATLLRRLLRGERVWQAHRAHYYQRMVRMGFGHRGTALIGYSLMTACAFGAFIAREASGSTRVAILAGMVVLLGAMAVWVDLRWARFSREGEPA